MYDATLIVSEIDFSDIRVSTWTVCSGSKEWHDAREAALCRSTAAGVHILVVITVPREHDPIEISV